MSNSLLNYLCSVEMTNNESPFINTRNIESSMDKENIECSEIHMSAELKRIMDMLKILQ